MKAVDLSPSMVETIIEMQRDAQMVQDLIKEVQEFILDLDLEGKDKEALKSLQCVKNLRSVMGYCNGFICENTQP